MRLHEPHDDRAGLQLLDLLDRQWLYGQHDVRRCEYVAARRRPVRLLVEGVWKIRPRTRTLLDEHPCAGLGKFVGHFRNEADPGFIWRDLAQGTDGYGHAVLFVG